ncbi:hypothetical protein D9M70_604820 [compost metagenome]
MGRLLGRVTMLRSASLPLCTERVEMPGLDSGMVGSGMRVGTCTCGGEFIR